MMHHPGKYKILMSWALPYKIVCAANKESDPGVIKLFFMLNSAEHEIYFAYKS